MKVNKKHLILLMGLLLPILFTQCGGSDSNSSGSNNGNNNGGDNNPSSPNGPTTSGKTHAFQISRYVTADLDATAADAILNDATKILQTKDADADVACEVVLVRQGEIGTFTDGNGTINSEEDFKAVLALPGHIKVVNQINWCGAFKPNVVGCAPTPGTSFVVVRHHASQEGILWNHELGHNKNLSHREAPGAIMNEFIDSTHLQVNATECTALMQ